MKKILIKGPAKRDELILAFPFFHALRTEFVDAEINLIVNDDLPDLCKFLNTKLNVKSYSFPLKKNSLWGIHHYSYNLLDVFNIDLFFDLEDSFKSAFMGITFRARERIGMVNGANRLWLTKKIKKAQGLKRIYDEYYLHLLEDYTGKKFDNLKICDIEIPPDPVLFPDESTPSSGNKACSVSATPIAFDEKQHFLISINESKNLPLWKSFFDCFISQKFIIVDNRSDTEKQNLLDIFKSSADNSEGKNSFKIITTTGPELLRVLIEESLSVITDEFWVANLASYLGKKAFVFINQNEQIPFIKYFRLSPVLVKLAQEVPVRVTTDLETKQISNIGEVVDFIHSELKI